MYHIIVTTINHPTAAVKELAEGAKARDWRFTIIGDSKSPSDFAIDGGDYYDVEAQIASGFDFARIVPTRHYARKNVGYLMAMRDKASAIIETDDDNLPQDGFWDERLPQADAHVVDAPGWVNVYRAFSDTLTWPRGLPLDEVTCEQDDLRSGTMTSVNCPIQQGLADDNPDVDAIYRLILPLPMKFNDRGAVALKGKASCPFNSQNTTWFPAAYPLLYLPYYCSFRMTDIWRSFIAQRVALSKGWGLLFHKATMYQVRNEHDLMRDFADEVVGYLNNRKIMELLLNVPMSSDPGTMLEELVACYEVLIGLGVVGAEERVLLRAWCDDIQRLAV